jgi:hypothetical protein
MSNQSPTANGPGQYPEPPVDAGLPDDRTPGKNRPLSEQVLDPQNPRGREERGNNERAPGSGQGA